jgi:cyclophilin family peptidyl-prolyl cis-trans isomerase
VSNGSRGKRRRGAQQKAAQPAPTPAEATEPVQATGVTSRLPVVPWLVAGAIAVVALIAILVVFKPGTGSGTGGAAASASPGPSGTEVAAGASGSAVAAGACPTAQPSALPAGETRTVTLNTPKGAIAIKVEADLSPIAAGNFVALASCGFYDGTPFHRTPTLQDGTPFVIQGGDPTGTGSGGPGYTITDEPVTTPYKRGTVAMARSQAPNSVGSQFFIVLDDKDGGILGQANSYQIIGNVTSGMEVADAIFVASAGVELPANPIKITTATVANP